MRGDDKRASHEAESYVNYPNVGKSGLGGMHESATEGVYDVMVMVVNAAAASVGAGSQPQHKGCLGGLRC